MKFINHICYTALVSFCWFSRKLQQFYSGSGQQVLLLWGSYVFFCVFVRILLLLFLTV